MISAHKIHDALEIEESWTIHSHWKRVVEPLDKTLELDGLTVTVP